MAIDKTIEVKSLAKDDFEKTKEEFMTLRNSKKKYIEFFLNKPVNGDFSQIEHLAFLIKHYRKSSSVLINNNADLSGLYAMVLLSSGYSKCNFPPTLKIDFTSDATLNDATINRISERIAEGSNFTKEELVELIKNGKQINAETLYFKKIAIDIMVKRKKTMKSEKEKIAIEKVPENQENNDEEDVDVSSIHVKREN
jgi:hypothetical protein